jgi:hypothetical protein
MLRLASLRMDERLPFLHPRSRRPHHVARRVDVRRAGTRRSLARRLSRALLASD